MKKLFLYIITPFFLLACKKEENSINNNDAYLNTYIHQLSDTTSYESIFQVRYTENDYLLLNNRTFTNTNNKIKIQYNSIIVDYEGNILSNCKTESSDICDSYSIKDTLLCVSCIDVVNKYNLPTTTRINILNYFSFKIPSFIYGQNVDSVYSEQPFLIYEGFSAIVNNLGFCEYPLCPEYSSIDKLQNKYDANNLSYKIKDNDAIAIITNSNNKYFSLWTKSFMNPNSYLNSMNLTADADKEHLCYKLLKSIEIYENIFY